MLYKRKWGRERGKRKEKEKQEDRKGQEGR